MISFPNCKINLGLNILRKNDDGYHDLETIFFPINIRDILEIIPATSNTSKLSATGFPIPDSTNNLCLKAYRMLREDFPQLPAVSIHLHKAIPLGAGLGGGSSDAAFTLRLIDKLFSLHLTEANLHRYAANLGSDCPFFLINKPCFATGRGEKLDPIELSLAPFKIAVITPPIHINTAVAFSKIVPAQPGRSIREIIFQPIDTWKKDLVNDFEKSIFIEYPEIEKIKTKLYNAGAVYASMSGSGSSIYGIFEKDNSIDLTFPEGYFYKTANTE